MLKIMRKNLFIVCIMGILITLSCKSLTLLSFQDNEAYASNVKDTKSDDYVTLGVVKYVNSNNYVVKLCGEGITWEYSESGKDGISIIIDKKYGTFDEGDCVKIYFGRRMKIEDRSRGVVDNNYITDVEKYDNDYMFIGTLTGIYMGGVNWHDNDTTGRKGVYCFEPDKDQDEQYMFFMNYDGEKLHMDSDIKLDKTKLIIKYDPDTFQVIDVEPLM